MKKSILALAVMTLALMLAAVPASAKLVAWNATVTIDTVGPLAPPFYYVGYVDKARIIYDDCAIDPVTHTVPIQAQEHYIAGAWSSSTPVSSQSIFHLDTRQLDYLYAVVHGTPIIIAWTVYGEQMIIQQDTGEIDIKGPYVFDPAGPYTIDSKPGRRCGDRYEMPKKDADPKPDGR